MSCTTEKVYINDLIGNKETSDLRRRCITGFYCSNCLTFRASSLLHEKPNLRQIKQSDIQHHMLLGTTPCDEAEAERLRREKSAVKGVSSLAEAVKQVDPTLTGRAFFDELRRIVEGKEVADGD